MPLSMWMVVASVRVPSAFAAEHASIAENVHFKTQIRGGGSANGAYTDRRPLPTRGERGTVPPATNQHPHT
jgi:hypothetical protein